VDHIAREVRQLSCNDPWRGDDQKVLSLDRGCGVKWRPVKKVTSETARRTCLTMASKRVVDAVSVGW